MAAPFLNRNSVVLIQIEGTYGSDSAPSVASDALLTTVPSLTTDAQVLDRNVTIGTLSPTQPVIGRKLVRCGFQTELKSETEAGDGSSSTPIDLDDLLQIAGLNPTYTAETGGANDGYITYAPLSTGIKSGTLYVFPGKEVRHKILGAFANLSFDFVAGQYPMINADVVGMYSEPTDTTAGTPTYDTGVPVQAESLTLVFGAVSGLVCRSFSLNLNNEIVERPDVNSAEGLKGLRIASRRPTGRFRIEKELVATWNPYAAMDAGTTYAVSFTHGSSLGKRITVTIPKFTITGVSDVDDNGINAWDIDGVCARNSAGGNDELTLKFF